MNRLTARLPVLRKAIIPPGGSGPVRMAEIGDPLIRAIARKAKFATCTRGVTLWDRLGTLQ